MVMRPRVNRVKSDLLSKRVDEVEAGHMSATISSTITGAHAPTTLAVGIKIVTNRDPREVRLVHTNTRVGRHTAEEASLMTMPIIILYMASTSHLSTLLFHRPMATVLASLQHSQCHHLLVACRQVRMTSTHHTCIHRILIRVLHLSNLTPERLLLLPPLHSELWPTIVDVYTTPRVLCSFLFDCHVAYCVLIRIYCLYMVRVLTN